MSATSRPLVSVAAVATLLTPATAFAFTPDAGQALSQISLGSGVLVGVLWGFVESVAFIFRDFVEARPRLREAQHLWHWLCFWVGGAAGGCAGIRCLLGRAGRGLVEPASF